MGKRCPRCGESRLSEFHRNRSRADGLSNRCRSCVRKYQKANWPTDTSRYSPAAMEKRRAASRRYHAENRDHHNAAVAAWKRANPDKHAEYERRRRAKRASCTGDHTAEDVKRQLNRQESRCFYCLSALGRHHVEHKVPLSRGGSNGPENIVVACPACNLKKGCRTADEFVSSGG